MLTLEESGILENDRCVRSPYESNCKPMNGSRPSRAPRSRFGRFVFWPAVLLASCVSGPSDRAYETAEEALTRQDWPRAADLWYSIHRAEKVKSPRPYLETARALYLCGDSESACMMIQSGLEVHPSNAGLLALYSNILEELGFKRAAELYYAQLVEADPTNFDGWVGLGRVRLGLGNESDAENPLRRALALSADDLESHMLLARVFQVEGDAPSAFDQYSRAIELGAKDLGFLLDAGAMTIEPEVLVARPEAAERGLKWIDTVIRADPQSTCAHFLRGVHMQRLGNNDEALVSFMRAVETDPSCVQALSKLATLYQEIGDELRKVEMATRALVIEQDPARRRALEHLLSDF